MNAKTTSRVTAASVAAELATLREELPGMLAAAVAANIPVAPVASPVPVTPAPRRKGGAQKVSSLSPRGADGSAVDPSPKLRAFTRESRRDFVAAARKEGKDFRHEVTGDDQKARLVGWTSTEIVTWCLANEYCPAGWRIADGWKARINAAE